MYLVFLYPVPASLVLSVAVNLLFFMVAFLCKTDKVTDLSYSLSFVLLVPVLWLAADGNLAPVQWLAGAAIIVWGLRLGSYLFVRILVTQTDARFDDKRNNAPRLLGFWLLQTMAVWLIMLPFSLVLPARSVQTSWRLSVLGFGLALLGLVVESLSDCQKFRFKRLAANKGLWIQQGLWRYCRHPNYLGELLFWWGLFAVVLPALWGRGLAWVVLGALGPLCITLLLLFVSGIPLLEKNALQKYGHNPHYIKYRESTPLLLPLPRFNRKARNGHSQKRH